jgi:KDO2-lipid IV(A) lauroyltransferase
VEYLGLRFGLFLIDHLPFSVSSRLARMLAGVWYLVGGRRRRIAKANIRRSGIAAKPADVARIARRSFQHLPLVALESIRREDFLDETNWRERVEMDVPEETLALLREPGRGLLLISGHLGNWEVAAQLVSFLKPVTGVTRSMNNPLAERLFLDRKPRERFTLTPKHDADTGRLLTVLKEGGVLALLVDQHARKRGMQVDFFGTPAWTHTSHALLHLVTRIPIVFGYCVRTGPMRFRLVADAPIRHTPTGNRQADILAILEELNRLLETAIRAWPEQYLWVHRRWRDVEGDPPASDRRESTMAP